MQACTDECARTLAHLHARVVQWHREVPGTHHAYPVAPNRQEHVGVNGQAHDTGLVDFLKLLGDGDAWHQRQVGHLHACACTYVRCVSRELCARVRVCLRGRGRTHVQAELSSSSCCLYIAAAA